jgi:four helix bundle protein
MQNFRELKVWQGSHALVLEVYRLTRSFPPEERFCLVTQLRRAAVSVPTNLAEGAKRQTRPDYARFINMAEGSLAETEYLITLSRDLGYLTRSATEAPLAEMGVISRMLHSLREKVETASANR